MAIMSEDPKIGYEKSNVEKKKKVIKRGDFVKIINRMKREKKEKESKRSKSHCQKEQKVKQGKNEKKKSRALEIMKVVGHLAAMSRRANVTKMYPYVLYVSLSLY